MGAQVRPRLAATQIKILHIPPPPPPTALLSRFWEDFHCHLGFCFYQIERNLIGALKDLVLMKRLQAADALCVEGFGLE